MWLSRQKHFSFSRQTTHRANFGRLRKNRSAIQRTRGPSTKTGGSRKGPSLMSKWDGVAPRIWVSPSTFGPLFFRWKASLSCICSYSGLFHAEHGAVWSVVGGSDKHCCDKYCCCQRATVIYRKNTVILTWATKSVKIVPGRLRTMNCKLLNEDDTQWQQIFVKQLAVTQPATFHAIGR